MSEYTYKKQNSKAGETAAQATPRAINNIPNSVLQEVFAGRRSATSDMVGHRQNIAPSVQAKMSRAFGMDFSNLQVYRSDAMAGTSMHGMAQGNRVVIGSDVNLNTLEGQSILGHELSHVRAQSMGIGSGRGLLNDTALEHQADTEGAMAARGMSVEQGGMTMGAGLTTGLGMTGIQGLTPVGGGMSASAGAPMQADKENPSGGEKVGMGAKKFAAHLLNFVGMPLRLLGAGLSTAASPITFIAQAANQGLASKEGDSAGKRFAKGALRVPLKLLSMVANIPGGIAGAVGNSIKSLSSTIYNAGEGFGVKQRVKAANGLQKQNVPNDGNNGGLIFNDEFGENKNPRGKKSPSKNMIYEGKYSWWGKMKHAVKNHWFDSAQHFANMNYNKGSEKTLYDGFVERNMSGTRGSRGFLRNKAFSWLFNLGNKKETPLRRRLHMKSAGSQGSDTDYMKNLENMMEYRNQVNQEEILDDDDSVIDNEEIY